MFKIGDEVICIKDNGWCEKDDWGIVTGFSDIGNPLIDFKERKEGKSYKLYIESENLQLKNQSNIKPEDMVSGEWYIVESDYLKQKHLIKFGYIKKTDIYTSAPFGYSYTKKFTHYNSGFSSAADKYNSIVKATKEEVLKYFPEEFKEPVNLDNRFKPNTWYKTTDNPYTFYVKNPFENGGLDSFKEHIYDNEYYGTVNLGKKGTYNYVEVPLSEIQEYLPEGHVDKLKQDTITEYLYYNGKFAEIVESVKEPEFYQNPVNEPIVVNTKVKDTDTLLILMKKQSKNNKPVLLKEQKLVNLSIKKQTKKSILLCQH